MSKIEKSIDLSTLPTCSKGVDWNNSIGFNIEFKYRDICGTIKIIGCDGKNITYKYNKKLYTTTKNSIRNCSFGRMLNYITLDFKFEINDRIFDETKDLLILEKEYRDKQYGNNPIQKVKYYKYHCNKCGHEDWKIENDILHTGCPVCGINPKVVVEGINDIPTTAPWMVKYFQGGYDEAKLYTRCSTKIITPICPDCKRIMSKRKISNIYVTKGVGCSCGDGWSYPNKFMFNLLEQLNVDFHPEIKFDWSNGKIYDEYIKYQKLNIIVENHGIFHYENNKLSGNTFKKEQENDNNKYMLAIENGIDKYIVIDCRYSDIEWIKNSILHSDLPILLNFEEKDINWDKCDEFASSNIAKIVSEYKSKNQTLSSIDISKIFKISRYSIVKYLKIGNKFGWCYYNTDEELKKSRRKSKTHKTTNPILCIETNQVFCSFKLCEKVINDNGEHKVIGGNIRRVCNKTLKTCGGLTFIHITKQEFNRIKTESPELAFGDFFILPEESKQ